MKTVASEIQVFNRREPIPGYVLQERIGEGGFGEVWKSEAPGGLFKAVKIVFGPVNARKAERELKSLNRVKQVQHPLLLSLERIEVIDGHLVIVTELADRSLSDRFVERIEEGHTGIPRDELLGYLCDAADALDYLYSDHSLQHLDVKPENLLLLAGRIKVADFGMVKDLHEQSETVIGGLTPLYAPPEIYDGKPNPHSDQYSLAIVFQYMLTGEPPFAGRTAAQLASQHLHSEPDLSSLSSADRTVVSRALSKDPECRFKSCREFVDALRGIAPPARAPSQRRPPRATRDAPRPVGKPGSGSTAIIAPVTVDFPCPADVETLPPLSDQPLDRELVPTVFVGVGALAGRTLQHLRRRLSARFGSRDAIPALQLLLIDTDVNALAAATRGPADAVLHLNETVGVPIKEAAHYREQAASVLEWLERRWLYNIPRSLQTEGIRPLGRLAFVDGFAAIADGLRRSVANATGQEFVETSSRTMGRPFAPNAVQVFVIGSTTGGTASGMLLDLPYAVRAILAERELADDSVHGIMMHATGGDGRSHDLQLANTIACLREFVHYSTLGSRYPGEPACGVPPFDDRPAPFAQNYLLHLGDRLTTPELDGGASMVADFLLANSTSPAAGVFHQTRDGELYPQYPEHECRLRTLCAAQVSGDPAGDQAATEYLCRLLVKRWLGDENREQLKLPEVELLAKKFVKGLDLSTEVLVRQSEDLTRQGVLVDDVPAYVRQVVDTALSGVVEVPGENPARALMESINDLLAGHGVGRKLLPADRSFQQSATLKLAGHAERRVDAFLDWFAMLAKQPKVRLRGVQHAVRCVIQQLEEIETQVLQISEERVTGEVAAGNIRHVDQLCIYGAVRLQQLADRTVLGYLRTVVVRLQEYSLQLHELCRRLDDFAHQFAVDAGETPAAGEVSLVAKRRWQLLVELEDALQETKIGLDALSDLATASRKDWGKLASTLRQVAGRIVASATTKQRVSSLVANRQQDSSSEIGGLLSQARPPLRECGGKERLIVLLPKAAQVDNALASLLKQSDLRNATMVQTDEDCITAFSEIGDVPVPNIISKLAGGHPRCIQLADRLRSRVDI